MFQWFSWAFNQGWLVILEKNFGLQFFLSCWSVVFTLEWSASPNRVIKGSRDSSSQRYWGVPDAYNIVTWGGKKMLLPLFGTWAQFSKSLLGWISSICPSSSLSAFLYSYSVTEDRYHSQMWLWDRHVQGKWHNRGTYLPHGHKYHYHFHFALRILIRYIITGLYTVRVIHFDNPFTSLQTFWLFPVWCYYE